MEDAKNSNSELYEIIPLPLIEGKKKCIVKKATYHSSQKRTVYLEKVVKNRLKNDNTRKFTTLEDGDYISQTMHRSPEEIRYLDY